jgi:PIN domain nuclease of toxin-antitoxin system
MRILLDTHLFLWWLKNDNLLTKKARTLITDADEVFVSSAAIWEIAIKVKLKKLDANVQDLTDAIEENGFLELPITAKHAAIVSTLPDIHRDPFDRIMLAQAITEPLQFHTADKILSQYSSLAKNV